ncbi:hypothetical protein CKO15_13125 [Halorhodospira abdelmalekii]|uniref:hypothetical protein n=1 Tax=Halorhodospira abdelmalekii TaxID=421629 RepID=UPI0019056392|nr:hypothetical protein [Halorhodospira abdelmalekii]MBK1736194.1 hypothetical protein [Halorhodospira abdelmalekii]
MEYTAPPPTLSSLFRRATVLWLVICGLAVGNGIAREVLLEPLIGPELALPLSGLILSALVIAIAYFGMTEHSRHSLPVLLAIGGYWLLLTILFELALGMVLLGQTWAQVQLQYSPAAGNLWIFVLATIAAAPWLSSRLRRAAERS